MSGKVATCPGTPPGTTESEVRSPCRARAIAVRSALFPRLRESGVRYPDVTFRVEDATVREGDAPSGADRLAVRATVSRAALEGRDGQGRRLDPVPAGTERVDLELARAGERWLLWSWEPAAG